MSASKKNLIVIVGPTAIGKTSLSISLGKYFNCEILSADSRQFFKEIGIGTAKPTLQEQEGIPHHFIDSLSLKDEYNAGKFENDGIQKLKEIFEKSDHAILVGGSGLYVDAICRGIDDIPSDPKIREDLNTRLNAEGIDSLQKELELLDPEHFSKMNHLNPQRLIRALEVCLCTGKTYSSFRNNKPKERPFNIIKIGLTAERKKIYSNINLRVDIMMKEGLLKEVESVSHLREFNSLNTVGYKEIFKHLDGELTLNEAVELIKKNTRNFAKRQLTWFKKDQNTTWFDISEKDQIIPFITGKITNAVS